MSSLFQSLAARITSLKAALLGVANAGQGAGLVGFLYALAYPANTVGAWLKSLAQSQGASFIGWVQIGTGAVLRSIQDKLRERVTARDFGAIGDGASHPLSGITSLSGVNTTGWTLAQWQVVYPHAKALTDEIDWCAIQAAINYLNPNMWSGAFSYQQGGGTVLLGKGVFRINRPLSKAPFVIIEGEGCDGWTGGGTGYGITGAASPANGSAIWADFGATTQTCAIDTQNWSVAGGTLYAATNMTPITVDQLGGTYTYCQGVGLRKLALFCTNGTAIGVRLQGAALAKLQDVSIIGFQVGLLSNCCWTYEYENLFINSKQVSFAALTNNAGRVSGCFDGMGWGTSDGATITSNGYVTAGNKPAFWSGNDTNYNPTGLYVVGSMGMRFEDVTCQHTGRVLYSENSDVSMGMAYAEDLPFLGAGATPGAFNGYNAAASNNSLMIDQLVFVANGATVFNRLTNLPVTLGSFSGLQGMMLGPTISGTTRLVVGVNVNRNGAFGDSAFNPAIINTAPEKGQWTPALTNIGGTGIVAQGNWVKRGNVYDVTVNITGVALTAAGGGASIISTPFNGTAGFPGPARNAAAAVGTANLQAVGALMKTDANLYVGAVASTTSISISFEVAGE